MRRWATLLLLLGTAWPAMAAKTLSVGQMERLLGELQGRSDGKMAAELKGVQMTERVSPARLARWEAESAGPQTRQTLTQLADLSAFLDPPASDVVDRPRPDNATQLRILRMAVQYVETTMARLPSFFATRATMHFEDTLVQHTAYSVAEGPSGTAVNGLGGTTGGPSGMGANEPLGAIGLGTRGESASMVFRALHATGTYSQTVTYNGGHEVLEQDTSTQKKEPGLGLTTHGEFGPILAQILSDALENRIGFLHWEKSASGPEAVFRYSVPAGASHFRVGIGSRDHVENFWPGYHGEIAIDAQTGAILRLSEVAEMTPPNQDMRAAIVVEYSPVTIGGSVYICPSSAVAYSKIPVPSPFAADRSSWLMQAQLNDIAFTHYHEFRSEARMIAGSGEGNSDNAADAHGTTPQESAAGPGPVAAAPGPVAAAPASSSPSASASAANTPASDASIPSAAAAAANPADHLAPNLTASAPAMPAAAPAANAEANAATQTAEATAPANEDSNAPIAGAVLHARSNLVLVDVVVTGHDKPVLGLDRHQFHVFEDGRQQPMVSFEENQPPPSVAIAQPAVLPPDTYSNVPAYPETSAVNVLLLDALNTPASDQEQVRSAMIHYLGTIKPGTPLAIFTLSSQLRMAAGFTTNVPQLLQALASSKTQSRTATDNLSGGLQNVAAGMANNHDPGTIWLVNTIQQFAADTMTYENDQRVTMTLDALDQLGRYLAAVPGRKNLIWFSGSFPIGLAPDKAASTSIKNMRDYADAMQATSDLLAAARVSVYPVDARGLLMSPTSDADYIPSPVDGRRNPKGIANDNTNFTEQTSLEHGSMNAIATETGGQVYTAGNDLQTAIRKIAANDAYYYTLSYVPPAAGADKHGAAYHTIEVKVDGGKYRLAYRHGYYANAVGNPTSGLGGASNPMAAAAESGVLPSTQILFQARVLPQGAQELNGAALDGEAAGEKTASFPGGAHRYAIDLNVQPQDVHFARDAQGGRHTQLDCELVAYDAESQVVNSLGRSFHINLSSSQYAKLTAGGGSMRVRLALDLPAGEIGLRVVVYDPTSAQTGSIEVPVDVARKPAGAQASVSSQ